MKKLHALQTIKLEKLKLQTLTNVDERMLLSHFTIP